jgi:hypothetical protein
MQQSIRIALLWLARILGGVSVLFFGAFFVGEGVPRWKDIEGFQLKSMLLLLAFSAFAYFFAWFRPKEGGIALTLAGFIMGMNMFYHGGVGDTVAALIYGLPFLVTGVLFWRVGSVD